MLNRLYIIQDKFICNIVIKNNYLTSSVFYAHEVEYQWKITIATLLNTSYMDKLSDLLEGKTHLSFMVIRFHSEP